VITAIISRDWKDWAIGISIAAAGVSIAAHGEQPIAVRASVALLDGWIGALFVARAPARAEGRWSAIAAALPSLLVGALAVSVAPRDWPLASEVAFVVGAIGTALAFASLGRSFAIFPARRAVATGGAYRIVRHPAYACELAMAIAAGAARAWWVGALVGLVSLAALVPRILAEERILADDPDYLEYRARVRSRLVPLLW
jgi:protein-S-isoprenylcysteine O-methyltransferase Ste14